MPKQMPKLRIAVLIDAWFPFHGGGQAHVKETLSWLRQKYKCQILIFHGFSSSLLGRLLWNLLVIPQLMIHHFIKPFDLLHAHAYSAGLSGKILSLILRVPVIYTVHGCNTLDIFHDSRLKNIFTKKGWDLRIKYWLERWLLTGIKYDAQITVAQNFLHYPNVNQKIYVIPNGVDINRFKIQDLRFKNKNKVIRLLFVGRLEKIKGVDILLRALAKVKGQLPEFELRIIGKGPEEIFLKDLAIKLALRKRVKFLGEKEGEDLIKEYQKADLFILPSLTEGQPLTVLEAWAAKLPVLVTKVGHTPYMVKEGVNGFLAEPGNLISLEKGLQLAFKERKKWSKIGETGYRVVKKSYTWNKTVSEIIKLYQLVLKRRQDDA